MPKTFVITPSYIASEARVEFASKSFSSIWNILGDQYPFIVVDDIPRGKSIFKLLPNFKYFPKCREIYNKENIQILRQYGRGSRLATLRAVREAKKQGADLVFIHLDDNIYVPPLKELMEFANDAFAQDSELLAIKLTDEPILSNKCNPTLGNLSEIKIENDEIKFDKVTLKPTRFHDYTLWWSYYEENMVDKDYWPISLWSILYRVDFLEKLLTGKGKDHLKHLVDIEHFYRKKANWVQEVRETKGKIGYINMQFVGIEMQNNLNWMDLIQYPNTPVL